jgi:large subunit ribosomal protein L10
MPRPEKVEAVAEIKQRLEGAAAVFAAEYAGLSVKQQQRLRRGLRSVDSEFKVVKMTLARRAAEELGHDSFVDLLSGPTGLAFAGTDPATTAKALRDFARENASLIIKGALLSGELLSPERIAALADLEPRDVLLAKVAGGFQAPLAKMARLLAALQGGFATALQQLIDKAPAEPAVAEPEPAAEVADTEPDAADAPEAAAEESPAEPTADAAAEEAGDTPAGDPDKAAAEAEEE